MDKNFPYGRWRALPIGVRARIAAEFGVPKRGSTHVSNDRIVSDGYEVEELEAALTPAAIAARLGTEGLSLAGMWDMLAAGNQAAPAQKAEKTERKAKAKAKAAK